MTRSQRKLLLRVTLATFAIMYVLAAAKWTTQVTQQTVAEVEERIAESRHEQGEGGPKEGFLNRLMTKVLGLPGNKRQ